MPRDPWMAFAPPVDKAGEPEMLEYAGRLAEVCRAEGNVDERTERLAEIRRLVVGSPQVESTVLRASALVLTDLVAHGWSCRVRSNSVQIARPRRVAELEAERIRIQRQLHVERNRQLQASSTRRFLAKMERRQFHRGRWTSVFSLMRDGTQLAEQLRRVRGKKGPCRMETVRPYIQFVRRGEICEQTGLGLLDIWRYFRHTWSNIYRSVPGRSLLLLVRDASVDPHSVIGIAALASSAVQIGVRDDWIGWSPMDVVRSLQSSASQRDVKWLLRLVDRSMAEIYQDDLLDPEVGILTRECVRRPTEETLQRLEEFARGHRAEHQRLAEAKDHKRSALDQREGAEKWRDRAETPLFRAKRCETLALLLRARSVLRPDDSPVSPEELRQILRGHDARNAIRSLVRRAKAESVGIAMADISVCGAVAPYSHLLGGKLVAMLVASPEVVRAYYDRYSSAESVIASSLAGRTVIRRPHLVFLGTTSLYGNEPTQYTRARIPCDRAGGRRNEAVRYRLLGRTEGYGTLQFAPDTVDALSTLLSQTKGGQRVHSIFGEGVNPRLRKVREGLDCLNLPSDELLTHGSARLVYGVTLVRNVRKYLLGLDSEPDYLLPMSDPLSATSHISAWWAERWLAPRIMKDAVLDEVAGHRLTRPVRHGARCMVPSTGADQLTLFADLISDV